MKIIECKDLTKEYISSDSTVKAVDNVSISFEQGEFCAVTGPSFYFEKKKIRLCFSVLQSCKRADGIRKHNFAHYA